MATCLARLVGSYVVCYCLQIVFYVCVCCVARWDLAAVMHVEVHRTVYLFAALFSSLIILFYLRLLEAYFKMKEEGTHYVGFGSGI